MAGQVFRAHGSQLQPHIPEVELVEVLHLHEGGVELGLGEVEEVHLGRIEGPTGSGKKRRPYLIRGTFGQQALRVPPTAPGEYLPPSSLLGYLFSSVGGKSSHGNLRFILYPKARKVP